jgi:hypothetical protein
MGMSASSAIGDVTQTLQELLQNEQQPRGMFNISLISPADEVVQPGSPNMTPTINLFLFRVIEDQFTKNQEWQAVGTDKLHYPPLALNLFYVLTPFAEDKLDEHRTLGEAMRVFYDHSIVKAPFLKGSLEDSTEELKVDLCQLSVEDSTRIWNALSKAYRLSVCYQVRIVMIDSRIEESTTRVAEKESRFL